MIGAIKAVDPSLLLVLVWMLLLRTPVSGDDELVVVVVVVVFVGAAGAGAGAGSSSGSGSGHKQQ